MSEDLVDRIAFFKEPERVIYEWGSSFSNLQDAMMGLLEKGIEPEKISREVAVHAAMLDSVREIGVPLEQINRVRLYQNNPWSIKELKNHYPLFPEMIEELLRQNYQPEEIDRPLIELAFKVEAERGKENFRYWLDKYCQVKELLKKQ